MATAPQGGLGAMAPARPPVPAPQPGQQPGQPPNPAQAAQRISGLEQEVPAEEDYLERALRNRRAQEAALNSQIEALRSSLDSRMNLPFDPSLMAAASGFLKPTKTGGFGESLGYAAEGYAAEAEKEFARKQQIQKAKLELTEKQAALAQQALLNDYRRSRSGEGTELVTGATGVPQAAVAQGAASKGTAGAMPSFSGRQVTQAMIDRAAQIDPTGNLAKELQAEAKLNLEAEKVSIDRQKAQQGERRKFKLPGLEKLGEIELDADEQAEYKNVLAEYRKTRDPQVMYSYYDSKGWMELGQGAKPNLAGATPPAEAAPSAGAVPSAGARPSAEAAPVTRPQFEKPKTPAEAEIEKAAKIERDKKSIEADADQRTRLMLSRDTAQERVIASNSIYGIAENKDTGKVFDLFSKPTVRNAIVAATTGPGGVRTPLGTTEIAALKPALLRASGNPALVDTAMMVLRNSTMLNLQDTISLMSKQGAITEGERALIANLNPNVWEDSRKSAMAKAQFVKARAEFDRDVAEDYQAWAQKNPNKYVDDFKSSKEYKDSYNHYNKVTGDLAKKYFPGFKGAPDTSRRAVPSNAGSLESQIR
jgi:hypothetical protein